MDTEHNQAKEHHEKALKIRRTIFGEQHSKVAASSNSLGIVYQDLGQHNQAKEHHEKALNIRRTIYGEQHSKVAASYNNLGLVYQDLGQHNQAKEHHEKALTIRRTIYGEQHSDVAASYIHLGGGEESKIFRRPSCIKYRKITWRPFHSLRFEGFSRVLYL